MKKFVSKLVAVAMVFSLALIVLAVWLPGGRPKKVSRIMDENPKFYSEQVYNV